MFCGKGDSYSEKWKERIGRYKIISQCYRLKAYFTSLKQ